MPQAATVSPTRIIALICIALVITALVLTRRSAVPDFHGARASEIETPGQGSYDKAGRDPGFFSDTIKATIPAHIAEGQTITLSYTEEGVRRRDTFTVVRIWAKKALCRLYDKENAGDGHAPGRMIYIKDCKVVR